MARAYYTSKAEAAAGGAAQRATMRAAAAKRITVTPDFSGGWHEIRLTVPDGYQFGNLDIHECIAANAGPTTDGLWQRALRDVEAADVVPCELADCEWCHEATDAIGGGK
jgi:hypothetical protein